HVDQKLHIFWRASVGLDYYDFMLISAPMLGKEVVFYLEREHVETNLGAKIEISYRVESPGEADQVSAATSFHISSRDGVGVGPLRIMGARFNPGIWRGTSTPRMLTALHDETLEPMRAEWRYEDEQEWTTASEWIDDKPWLRLHVRNNSETWECRTANIIGSGINTTQCAAVALRDEVLGDSGPEVDMVAWGNPEVGGELNDNLIALKQVAEVTAAGFAFAARLRDGNLMCWGDPLQGGSPAVINGDFVQVRSNLHALVARDRDGELFAWGADAGVPVPERVLQYKDYVDLYGSWGAFAARRASGHVMAWGNPAYGGQLQPGQENYDDIVDLVGNSGGFAALRVNGNRRSVIAWGTAGNIPSEIANLTNIRRVCAATSDAFCVLLETGEVKAWPKTTVGGQIPDDIEQVKNVVEVTSTGYAFCARLSSGRVVAWGDPHHGATLNDDVLGRSDIVQVTGNYQAFAALCRDGTVLAWGHASTGGDTSRVADRLVNVRAVYSSMHAFVAVTADGQVVTWGSQTGAGNSDEAQPELEGRVTTGRRLSTREARALAQNRKLDG
ncbi:RCC1 domain-containing protein, partial [Pseudomonas japonica]|uniref:RCC1 domain-containing protein n=1 Tax=Pseudomonas japonica TaxID=256466 RepID=UPI0038074364